MLKVVALGVLKFVVSTNNNKKRRVVDYSETLNKFTNLDAFPIPNMSSLIEKISCNKVFSTIDLTSAYHLIHIPKREWQYTAFQACGKL